MLIGVINNDSRRQRNRNGGSPKIGTDSLPSKPTRKEGNLWNFAGMIGPALGMILSLGMILYVIFK